MSKQVYDWKRFWCPRTGSINSTDSSYLSAPAAEWNKSYNQNLVTLEEIADKSCLVLLGEPGLGKSQELDKLKSYTVANVDGDDQILELDLDDCTKSELHSKLFKSTIFTSWLEGTHCLYLFLDSLDEGWKTIQKLPILLAKEFESLDESKYKDLRFNQLHLSIAEKTGLFGAFTRIKNRPNLSRIRLRIVCRTIVFSQAEGDFARIWGNNLEIYDLKPLNEIDIAIALDANKLNVDNCLEEIKNKRLLPLASKPISLTFILQILKRNHGKIPYSYKLSDLYFEGCKELCREPKDITRHPLSPVSNLEIDQRLVIAAHIAAITIFCKRPTVWIRKNSVSDISESDVLLEELCCGDEYVNCEKGFLTNEKAIYEVLDTSLFSSYGCNRVGWSHQTYAEFLAAWYLVKNKVTLPQMRELFLSSTDLDGKLIPQLYETAAWVVNLSSDFRDEIIKTDPDILLQSNKGHPIFEHKSEWITRINNQALPDLAVYSPKLLPSDITSEINVRASIVESLLTQLENANLFSQDYISYRDYAKLKHPGLGDQLRPYIHNHNKLIDVRDLAINIAEACEITELQEDLANLALDASQSIHLRVSASKAVGSLGNAETKLKLKPLIIQELQEDDSDRLKGSVLDALWPIYIEAQEVFRVLTRPKKRNFYGTYQYFIDNDLAKDLKPEDLVFALQWLEKQGVRCFGHPFESLGNSILLKAWKYFDLDGVAESFAKVALVQWKEHQKIITRDNKLQEEFSSLILNDSLNRQALVERVVLIVSTNEEDPFFLCSSLTDDVLLPEDVFWMLEKLQESNDETIQKNWAQLILWNFDPQDVRQISEVVIAARTIEVLKEFFSPHLTPVELFSAQADKMRSEFLRIQEMRDRNQQKFLLEPSPQERIKHYLERLENGELSAWWQLNVEMTLKSNSQRYGDEFEIDLTNLPGWKEADEVTRTRIIEGAKKYIQEQNDLDYEWIGTNTFNRPSVAGCKALHLLLNQEVSLIKQLSPEKWKVWVPIIIAYPSSNQHGETYLELVKCAYLYAPQESLHILLKIIDIENREHDYLFVIDRLEKCWDEQLKLAFLEKAKDSELAPRCFGQLLEKLLQQKFELAKEYAKDLIRLPLSVKEDEKERTLIAARVLVENSDVSSWSFIWSLIQESQEFGSEVVERVAFRFPNGLKLNMTEKQIADLFAWMVRKYPYDQDPDHSNDVMAYDVTTRDSVARLRDSLLSQLKERGTSEACSEIQRLIQAFPELEWLRRTLISAKANMRRTTWQPLEPKEFLQLVISPELSNLEVVDRITKKMEDNPKIENKITISDSSVYGPIAPSGVTNNQVTVAAPDTKNGINWGNWLSVGGILVAIIAILVSVAVSGAFTEEFKEWWNRTFSSEVEQQPIPKSQ